MLLKLDRVIEILIGIIGFGLALWIGILVSLALQTT